MHLSSHKTKIVCTVGPASRSLPVLKAMMESGMNVARLNFSHGTFDMHKSDMAMVRKAALATGRLVSILIDLPGAKMRVGQLAEPLVLKKGDKVILTERSGISAGKVIPVEYKKLATSVSVGGVIYLSDGFIQLKVQRVKRRDVLCQVTMGGTLTSHKGLNLPGAKLFIEPVTKRDLTMVDFGLKHGVNTFGLSFVEHASDILKVRQFAQRRGQTVYLIAKIIYTSL